MSNYAARSASGVIVILALATVLTLPNPPLINKQRFASPSEVTTPVVTGAFHVHTIRSDGSGTVDEIASAADMAISIIKLWEVA